MRRFRTHTRSLRLVAAVLLAVSAQACMHWTLVPEPKSLASKPRTTVRITVAGDAKHMVVKHPTISGDSLVWTDPQRSGIPLKQVAWVEARSLDPVASGFFLLVGLTFLGVVVLRQ